MAKVRYYRRAFLSEVAELEAQGWRFVDIDHDNPSGAVLLGKDPACLMERDTLEEAP